MRAFFLAACAAHLYAAVAREPACADVDIGVCDTDGDIVDIELALLGLFGPTGVVDCCRDGALTEEPFSLTPCGYGTSTCTCKNIMWGPKIRGSLPEAISNCTDLEKLNIGTGLSGTLPAWINKLTKLEELQLGNNELEGPLPDIPDMINLKEIFLESNMLTGTFPSSWEQLPNLETVVMHNNHLAGEVPLEWCDRDRAKDFTCDLRSLLAQPLNNFTCSSCGGLDAEGYCGTDGGGTVSTKNCEPACMDRGHVAGENCGVGGECDNLGNHDGYQCSCGPAYFGEITTTEEADCTERSCADSGNGNAPTCGTNAQCVDSNSTLIGANVTGTWYCKADFSAASYFPVSDSVACADNAYDDPSTHLCCKTNTNQTTDSALSSTGFECLLAHTEDHLESTHCQHPPGYSCECAAGYHGDAVALGAATCTVNVCECLNGVGTTNIDCASHGDFVCASCDSPGYTLENAFCEPNVCTCEGGVGSEGDACPINGEAHCASCTGVTSKGYFHLDDAACKINVCRCEFGAAASRHDCATHNVEQCESCYGGFELSRQTSKCVCTDTNFELIQEESKNDTCVELSCSTAVCGTGAACDDKGTGDGYTCACKLADGFIGVDVTNGPAECTLDPCKTSACESAAPCFTSDACQIFENGIWTDPYGACTSQGAAQCAACYPDVNGGLGCDPCLEDSCGDDRRAQTCSKKFFEGLSKGFECVCNSGYTGRSTSNAAATCEEVIDAAPGSTSSFFGLVAVACAGAALL